MNEKGEPLIKKCGILKEQKPEIPIFRLNQDQKAAKRKKETAPQQHELFFRFKSVKTI